MDPSTPALLGVLDPAVLVLLQGRRTQQQQLLPWTGSSRCVCQSSFRHAVQERLGHVMAYIHRLCAGCSCSAGRGQSMGWIQDTSYVCVWVSAQLCHSSDMQGWALLCCCRTLSVTCCNRLHLLQPRVLRHQQLQPPQRIWEHKQRMQVPPANNKAAAAAAAAQGQVFKCSTATRPYNLSRTCRPSLQVSSSQHSRTKHMRGCRSSINTGSSSCRWTQTSLRHTSSTTQHQGCQQGVSNSSSNGQTCLKC